MLFRSLVEAVSGVGTAAPPQIAGHDGDVHADGYRLCGRVGHFVQGHSGSRRVHAPYRGIRTTIKQ